MNRNLMPIIGSTLGIVLIFWSITSSGEVVNFVDGPSVVITLFGSFSALMISFPYKTLRNIPRTMKNLMITPKDKRDELVVLFSNLAKKARADGLLALEDGVQEIDDDLLASGIQMVVDGIEPDSIKEILTLKLDSTEKRHREGQEVFEKWGELAPAFGMLGTLIGLIIMLSHLNDPSSIGVGMATALLTTFYGSLLANLIFIPIANNLGVQTDEEMFTGELIIEGVLQIQAGSNPRILEERLMTYLSPSERDRLEKSGGEIKEERIYE